MNKAMITGRITKDLELRNTKSGTTVCEFTLATNRPVVRDGEKQVDFINCIVWNKQAENLCKYQSKGSLVGVIGELRTDTYEVNDEKRYKTYVLVNNLEFLESKQSNVKTNEKEEENNNKTQNNVDNPFEQFAERVEVQENFEYEDSDLPF